MSFGLQTAAYITASVLFILVFLLSVAGSFFAYHKGIKLLAKRVDMDKYFHPIFNSRKR